MKTCPICNTTMVENVELRTNDGMGLCLAEKGLFGCSLGKVACAVCPECGHIETYLTNTDKVKKVTKQVVNIYKTST